VVTKLAEEAVREKDPYHFNRSLLDEEVDARNQEEQQEIRHPPPEPVQEMNNAANRPSRSLTTD